MKSVSLAFIIASNFLCFQLKAQTILYVDNSVAVSGNGQSWATAYKYLHEAEYFSWQNLSVKEIRIAAGSYYPNYAGFKYSNVSLVGQSVGVGGISSRFTFRNGLKIEGGFPVGGGVQNVNTNIVYLIGGFPPNIGTSVVCVIGANPIWDNTTNTYVSWKKSDSTSINGLIFNNQNRYYYTPNQVAVETNGLLVSSGDSAKLVIKNCQFANNGVGIFAGNTIPIKIDSCVFYNNNTGCQILTSLATVSNSLFLNNSTYGARTTYTQSGSISNRGKISILSCNFNGDMTTSAIEGAVEVKKCNFYGLKGNGINIYGNSSVLSSNFDSCFIAIKTAPYFSDTLLIDSCNISNAAAGSTGVSFGSGGLFSIKNSVINNYENGIVIGASNSFIENCQVSLCKVGLNKLFQGLSVINNCVITHNSDVGIFAGGATNIKNCYLDSNKKAIDINSYGKLQIDSNIILHSKEDALSISLAASDSFFSCSNNSIIYGKKNGIRLTAFSSNIVSHPLFHNNIIQHFDSAGISFQSGYDFFTSEISSSNISSNKYGVKCQLADVKISNSDIYLNKFGVHATSIYGDIELNDSRVYSNTKSGVFLESGGGNGIVNIVNTEIVDNIDSTTVGGAGIYAYNNLPNPNFVSINIIRSKIYYNFSKGSGGGIYSNVPLTIQNSIIANNQSEITSSGGGGGLYLGKYGGKVYNTVFANNSAFKGGGAVTIDNSTTDSISKFSNCTFYNNTTFDFIGAGAIANNGLGSNIIRNSIFWDNKQGASTNVITSDVNLQSTNNMIQKSMLQLDSFNYSSSGLLQQNMYQTNPNFYNTTNLSGADNTYGTNDDGLYLTTSSPCVNIGVNGWAEGNYDASNYARIQQNIVDFGAYEGALAPLSTNDLDLNSAITIYPNPTNTFLDIINTNNLEISEINIYNLVGQKVITRKENFENVDVSNLESSIYIIEIFSKEKATKLRFIKN